MIYICIKNICIIARSPIYICTYSACPYMIKFSQATFPCLVGWVPARRSTTKDGIPCRVIIASRNPSGAVFIWPRLHARCVNHLGECRYIHGNECRRITCANADAHAMKCEEVQVAS